MKNMIFIQRSYKHNACKFLIVSLVITIGSTMIIKNYCENYKTWSIGGN